MIYVALYLAIGALIGILATNALKGQISAAQEATIIVISALLWPYLVAAATYRAYKRP